MRFQMIVVDGENGNTMFAFDMSEECLAGLREFLDARPDAVLVQEGE